MPEPRVAGVVPARAGPGTVVSITGSALCQVARDDGDDGPAVCPDAGTVSFGSYPAAATSWADDVIMAEVPAAPPGRAPIRVLVRGRTSNAIEFVVE